jgi:carboxymethylenebutenolidase
MIEEILDIATRSGAMETFIVHPERNGPHPAVCLLMDAPGIREELYDMARRLCTVGYYVVLPNLYYRAGKATKYGPDVTTKGSAEQARMRAVRTKMTIPPVMEDIADLLAFPTRGETRSGGRAWLLHERPIRPGCGRPIPRPHRRSRIILWHVAGQRRSGKPASDLGKSQR